ncbi:MAG: hypothetical protein FJW64_08330 [Actinobacteria bacterium]|nr:hypothetical protein [Actinomycetota bacterium]
MSPVKPPADDATFAEAKAVNAEFKRTVAEVQEQIYDGDWRVWDYGDVPQSCGETGYKFSLIRKLPLEFSFHERGPERMKELHAWMRENGWNVEPIKTYSPGIDNLVIVSSKQQGRVARLDIDLVPGRAADGTIDVMEVRATSTCAPGDAYPILERLRGPFQAIPVDPDLPTLERPRDTPLFEPFDQKTRHPKPADSEG